MALKAKAGSGSVAATMHSVHDGTPRSLRRGRPPKNPAPPIGFQSEYEKARILEISTRAQFYRLKVEKLSGELLDRRIVIAEFTAIFAAIREIILASSMTTREKNDCLRNLTEIPLVLANVAAKQKEEKDETIAHNGGSEL
jgi:hypothetical protein